MHNVHKLHNDLKRFFDATACPARHCARNTSHTRFRKYACIALLVVLGGLRENAKGQEDAEDSPYRPGLIASYSAGPMSVVRTDEIVAFDWQDAACDPRLPAGDFTAEWRGRLWARGAGSYTFACYVQGDITVKLGGKAIISGRAQQPQWLASQPLDLDFDYHPLEITFRRTQSKGQLALFWSGPDFRLEPIPERALMHEREKSLSIEFERGRQLATALRCAACHADSAAAVIPAPALDRLSGNVHESWLTGWLASNGANHHSASFRRMPDLGMTQQEAEAIAAWLISRPAKTEPKKEPKEAKVAKDETKKSEKSGKKSKGEEKPKPSAAEGKRIILTRGCLACHKFGEFGESGLFGGGDLTALFSKRPADFLNRWLQDPAAINKQHRMPVFTFTSDELTSLSLWAKEHSHKPEAQARGSAQQAVVRQGERLVEAFKCAACHSLTSDQKQPLAPSQKDLTSTSDWSRSCANEPNRDKAQPGYRLSAADQKALQVYYSASRPSEGKPSPQSRGRDLLVQLNCLACHQREGVDRSTSSPLPLGEGGSRRLPGEGATAPFLSLQDKLVAVSNAHSDLAPLVPAMTPPALNSVGDKLQDSALADAISRKAPPHRPYLLVQMPKFDLSSEQLSSLVAYFTATDRIPPFTAEFAATVQNPKSKIQNSEAALAAAGPRLVTTDGLACTSCHQVGSVLPSKAPLNARGPDMSMLGKRIRREWFDRWCDNPARIVPRMEMPAVKVPVRGVLDDNIKDQLAAVWHILNTPGFEPPEPNPVRVLRLSGIPEKNERPIVIHDVVKDGDKTYLYPLVIGLPNRHNILFDLETNRLAAWWLGDTARQRTKGKSWYWEMGGKPLFDPGFGKSDTSFMVDGKDYFPELLGQSALQLENYGSSGAADVSGCVTITPRTSRPEDLASKKIQISQSFIPRSSESALGVERSISFQGEGPVTQVRLRIVSPELARQSTWDERSRTLTLPGSNELRIHFPRQQPFKFLYEDGQITVDVWRSTARETAKEPNKRWESKISLQYLSGLTPDQYLGDPQPVIRAEATLLQVGPGFSSTRLPLDGGIMPTALTWQEGRELTFSTLKGEIFEANDNDRDTFEDSLKLLADGLATPYGIASYPSSIFVAAKDGLLHLDYSGYGQPVNRIRPLVSAWGRTDDYHDWAVGLLTDGADGLGAFYVALPCQQDQRSEASARYRGNLLKIKPRVFSDHDYMTTRGYDIEIISSGHRFPMGMARNRDGELFVTDNQGNYNPFNELNHVKKGAHYGFINTLEKEKGYKPPPLTPPAINIPHPWTRSVNGICFLDTPALLAGTKPGPGASPTDSPSPSSPSAPVPRPLSPASSIYGPLEGHLIGCEYDTRRLIRMSLDKVNGDYQGCCYPLSIPPADVEKGLLGPIVCAIKPTTGELYVGEIRDSGWGAGNNIGQIVKIKIEPEKLPCGIAEVRATKTGFSIDFFRPIDRSKAADLTSYSIQSYRRESTPAYGGPDLDRRTETINTAVVSADGKRVTLTLPELRAGGHVYEIRVKNLAPGGEIFHPDEAHYTMNQIPE